MSGGSPESADGNGDCGAEDGGGADGATPFEELGYDPTEPDKPVLVWDGTCSFCRRSLDYVRGRAGDALHYVPYQRVHEHFERLDSEDFARAVHLIEPDGVHSSGAEAILRALDHSPGGGAGRWLYDNAAPFADISEAVYRFVAGHRPLTSKLSRWIVAENLSPTGYRWARWLFLRALALILLAAFASFGSQILGLIGSGGIEPAVGTVDDLRRAADRPKTSFGELFWNVPTLFWWWRPTDAVLTGCCWVGSVLSVGLFAGVWPRLLLPVVWMLYLSLVPVSGPFLGYQWDQLLLEASFLAWLLAPGGLWTLGRAPDLDRAPVWLLQWLAFRLMFMSGLEKLIAGDPTWRDMSALTYHFWTQPLPTWTAYWVHQLPDLLLSAATLGTLVLEVAVPLLVFGPRRLKRWAAYGFIGLQVAVFATGNYTFFNLLTIAVCLLLIDDSIWSGLLPQRLREWVEQPGPTPRTSWARVRKWSVAALAVPVFAVTTVKMLDDFYGSAGEPQISVPTFVSDVASWSVKRAHALDGFRTFNNYGLFVNMTTERPEILVQGSDDGKHWETYQFRWKPDDPGERPGFVEPHQPRLDWQMWFQALRLERARERTGRCRPSPWFLRFQRRLLEGSEPVERLLADHPFEGSPPTYIRAVVYDYHFADPGSDDWWRQENRRAYCPTYTLQDRAMRRVSTPKPSR